MPPLPQKKSDSTASVEPAWHPNLRLAARLPDTKVVRTAFFVNGGAVAVALFIGLWCCKQAWEIHTIQNEISDRQRQIDADKPSSDQAIALFARFKAEEAKAAEVYAFAKGRPAPSELLLRLAQTLPKKIALDSLELRDTGIVIHATVRGAPDKATGDASAYLETLRKDKFLGPLASSVSLTNLSRNLESGRLSIDIFVEYKKGQGRKT